MYTSRIAISWQLSERSICSQTSLSPAEGAECPLLHHQLWAASGPITAWLSGDDHKFIDIIAPVTQTNRLTARTFRIWKSGSFPGISDLKGGSFLLISPVLC